MSDLIGAGLLALLLAAPASAEGPLSWQDCVSIASRRNPDLAASRETRDASRQSYRGSFNNFLPQLALSNFYSDSNTGSIGSKWNAKASASMSLVDFGKIAGIRSSAAALAGAEAQLRLASAGVRLSLRQAFLQLVFAQENTDVARRVEAIRRRGSEMVGLRYDSGRESKGNMLRARAQLLQAQVDLAQSGRDLRAARSLLGRQLGMDEWRVLAATGALAAAPPPPPPDDSDPLVSRRPEVAVQEAAVKSAQAALASAQSVLWPTLSTGYSRTVADSREFPSSIYGWAFTGTLSLPLLAGGPTAAYYNITSAKDSLAAARQGLRQARVEALADIEQNWSSYAQAADQVLVQARLLEAARQRGDEADIRYASGLLSYDNWEIINTDRVNQERQALQARLNVALAEAAWDRATSRELGE